MVGWQHRAVNRLKLFSRGALQQIKIGLANTYSVPTGPVQITDDRPKQTVSPWPTANRSRSPIS